MKNVLSIIIAVIAILFTVSHLQASVPFISFEERTYRSECVAYGEIVQKNDSELPELKRKYIMTLKIIKQFKGDKREEVTFLMPRRLPMDPPPIEEISFKLGDKTILFMGPARIHGHYKLFSEHYDLGQARPTALNLEKMEKAAKTATAWSKFDILDKSTPSIEDLGKMTGDNLAWGESYRLMAYVSMYKGTGKTRYLEKAIKRIDAILEMRDDKKNVKDHVRNKIMKAWSSTKYTKKKNYAWIVHAGMITYPIAYLSYTLLKRSWTPGNYRKTAEKYKKALIETIECFNDQWRTDEKKRTGWYYGTYLKRPLPLNQQNALGRTIVYTWLLTGDEKYRTMAAMLARYYKAQLKIQNEGYIWPYNPGGPGSEDISHASINVDFAICCHSSGIVFTRPDMIMFSKTLKRCYVEGSGFTRYINGKGGFEFSPQAGRWARLCYFDKKLWDLLIKYLEKDWNKNIPTGMTWTAYMVETSHKHKMESVIRD